MLHWRRDADAAVLEHSKTISFELKPQHLKAFQAIFALNNAQINEFQFSIEGVSSQPYAFTSRVLRRKFLLSSRFLLFCHSSRAAVVATRQNMYMNYSNQSA